jgi:hypothetical protein
MASVVLCAVLTCTVERWKNKMMPLSSLPLLITCFKVHRRETIFRPEKVNTVSPSSLLLQNKDIFHVCNIAINW